jgi:DNA-binding CsgD family transcriptional regulator
MWSAEGDRSRARALWEGLARRADEAGDYSSLTFLLANLAEARLRDGDVEQALAGHERAERLARSVGQETALAHSLIWRAAAFARLGREADARAAEAEARQVIARTGWRAGEAALVEHMAGLELSLGNPGAAHELLAAARASLMAGIDDPPWRRELVSQDVEALVALGRLDEARALLEPYETFAARMGRRPDVAAGLRARGLLEAATGDAEAATATLERARAAYEELADPWGEARTLLALGQVHRRARRRAQAHEALAAAAERYTRLGAGIWAERARTELERGAPRREDASGLTETQRRVAELVRAGRTNREVADTLFMSIHTVEAHLTAIYRELGVRSRVALAAALRDADDGSVRDPGSEDPQKE